jgi:hypothetical protein
MNMGNMTEEQLKEYKWLLKMDELQGDIPDPSLPTRRDILVIELRRLGFTHQKYLAELQFFREQMFLQQEGEQAIVWRRNFVRAVHPVLSSGVQLLLTNAALHQSIPKDAGTNSMCLMDTFWKAVQWNRQAKKEMPLAPHSEVDQDILERAQEILCRATFPSGNERLDISLEDTNTVETALTFVDGVLQGIIAQTP